MHKSNHIQESLARSGVWRRAFSRTRSIARTTWSTSSSISRRENAKRIADWEHSGLDYSSWPGLDVKVRELAGNYPALGIGTGYENGGYDDTDYARQLWDLLREGVRPIKPRHDQDILRRAAQERTDFAHGRTIGA